MSVPGVVVLGIASSGCLVFVAVCSIAVGSVLISLRVSSLRHNFTALSLSRHDQICRIEAQSRCCSTWY